MASSERVNIIKLAKELNLSKSTVSRVFRGAGDIKPQTRERILAKAKELKFLPNHHASNLRIQKSNTIALIVPDISNSFLSKAVSGIEKVASENDYHVLICLTDNDAEKELSFIEKLSNGRVDGVIMSASGDDSNLAHLSSWEIPLVFLDQVHDKIKTSSVVSDDYLSSFQATAHLIGNGCKKIVYLTVNKNRLGKNQIEGYIDALRANGIPLNDDLIITCGNEPTRAKEILADVFQTIKPDGIFASAEELVIASYHVCQELGIPIPGGIRMIGVSNLELPSLLDPSLTTIVKPAFDIGIEAARLLFRMLDNKEYEKRAVRENVVLQSVCMKRQLSLIYDKVSV